MIKLPKAIICDIDGTLALFGDNHPYNRDYSQDIPNEPVVEILKKFYRTHRIVLVSGRMEKNREVTEAWLKKHDIPFDEFYMRETDDIETKDDDVKLCIYEAVIRDRWDVLFVLDDRDRVVKMWREVLGLLCLQVDYGNF